MKYWLVWAACMVAGPLTWAGMVGLLMRVTPLSPVVQSLLLLGGTVVLSDLTRTAWFKERVIAPTRGAW